MDIIGKEVKHKFFGLGTVTAQTEDSVTVSFRNGEKKFQYPMGFKNFLTVGEEELQSAILEEIRAIEREELENIANRIVMANQADVAQRRRRNRAVRPNIAFKCNYCDGGRSDASVGFNGVCSDAIIRYNIEVEQRTWCCSEECRCKDYLCGRLTREELDNEVSGGGYVCYESQMLREWKAMAGLVQHGERAGEPMRLKNVQENSLCILTTRAPDSSESERQIFAVFLVDDIYEGDDREEGFVTTQSRFKLALSPDEARNMPFWRYHANENNADKEAWSSGLHRYLDDKEAVQILRDIVRMKQNTEDGALADEFLTEFCRMVGISADEAGAPEGALTRR